MNFMICLKLLSLDYTTVDTSCSNLHKSLSLLLNNMADSGIVEFLL